MPIENIPRRGDSDLPGNSHKQKERQKKVVEKVVQGNAIQRKKSLGQRVAETFTADDMQSVGSHILFDVLIPAAKNTISDMAIEGVNRLLFGDSRRSISGGNTPYNRLYRPGKEPEPSSRKLSYRARASHDFNEIILERREEAENVLERLNDLIDNYDVATISDLYDLTGISGSFTDDKWGWFELRGADIIRVRGGFMLDLPKPKPID